MLSYILHKSHLLYFGHGGASLLGFRNEKENRSYNKNEKHFFVFVFCFLNPCDLAAARSAEHFGRIYLLVSVFSVSNP